MRRALSLVGLLCLAGLTARAQDPVNLDAKQYKVEIENAQVRVLRVHDDPHGRSSMHEHPAGVVVWLTDDHEKLTFPNGKTQESHSKVGQVSWIAGTKHAAENMSDKPFEVIFVELKVRPATSKPLAAKKKR